MLRFTVLAIALTTMTINGNAADTTSTRPPAILSKDCDDEPTVGAMGHCKRLQASAEEVVKMAAMAVTAYKRDGAMIVVENMRKQFCYVGGDADAADALVRYGVANADRIVRGMGVPRSAYNSDHYTSSDLLTRWEAIRRS